MFVNKPKLVIIITMNAKDKANLDKKQYPDFFLEILNWMDTYNLSRRKAAEKLGMDRQELDRYVNHPEKIPNPKLFTGFAKLFPKSETKLLKHVRTGKGNGNGH